MVLTEIQAHVPILSRQDQYRLVEFIIHNLSQEEREPSDIDSTKSLFSHNKTQSKAQAIDSFIIKWRGFLRNIDPDKEKHLYLQEKYQ